MSTVIATRPWDLRHLQQFLPSFPVSGNDQDDNPLASPNSESSVDDDDDRRPLINDGLGDFSKIYKYLGKLALRAADSSLGSIPVKDDYASDGAIPQNSVPPRHQASCSDFSDGMDGLEAVFAADQPDSETSSGSTMVNSQHKKYRKKARRKERKAMPAAQRTALFESEFDSNFGRETPARKASSHGMMTRSVSAKVQTEYVASNEEAIRAVAQAAARLKEENEMPDTPCPTMPLPRVAKPGSKPLLAPTQWPVAYSVRHQVPASTGISTTKTQSGPPYIVKCLNLLPPSLPLEQDNGPPYIVKTHNPFPPSPLPKLDSGPPYVFKTHNLIPSSIRPSQSNGKASNGATQHVSPPRTVEPAAFTPTIEPITLRSGVDREMSLFFKILHDFYPDRQHLVRPANLTTHDSDPAGIHVFVDASNIFIGFVDQLKRSRNIHPYQRVPDVNLSFDSLALLIERRRPVAKRVLVGSTPHIPAFDKAKAVGYEVSVLEKVMKARELTERQIYFKENDALRSGRKSSKRPPPHKIALEGSVLTPGGSETTTAPQPQFAPVRLVEQGVDEILHLKMMESMLDAEKPGIMVLATGDAAQAEYSSGFMAMVERALRKGWHVELTSWAKNVSSLYRHKTWTAAWGDRFRIIELDAYAEELLDM